MCDKKTLTKRKHCIECGRIIWHSNTPFCKTCAIEFYNDDNARLNGSNSVVDTFNNEG